MTGSDKNDLNNTENQSLGSSFENKTNSDKMRCRKTRKRRKPPSDEENSLDSEKESEIDISLEKKLRECAKRNNLSPLEVKKLLRKIVGNDHVLALVKLQEEEELNREANCKTLLKNDEEHSSDKEKDVDSTPKLTRAKAKALNKKPVNLPSLNEIEPEPEVTALITEEMNTDDEDEDDEYEPKEEDYIYSEDDFNTTASDLDSQPRTPMTNISYCSEVESPIINQSPKSPIFSVDGVFKIPRERTLSGLTKEDEIIAKRTRSKLCLQTTSIEALESTFIPPDITKDMYEFDQEVDQDWAQFLNEFTKPLNNTTVAEEDDPEEDPEYVATDKVPIDAEELKDINISKKELNDLVAELFDGLIKEGVFLENIPDLETPKKPSEKICQRSGTKSPPKKKSKFCVESQPIFTSPSCERFSENNFQMSEQIIHSENHTQINCNTNELLPENNLNNSLFLNANESIFTPNVMSTPSANTQIVRISTIETPQQLQTPTFETQNNRPSISTTAVQYTQTVVHVAKTNITNEFTIAPVTQPFCNTHINSNQQSYNLTQSSATDVVNSVPSDVRVFPYETNFNTTSNIISTNAITNIANIESQQSQQQTTADVYQPQTPITEFSKSMQDRNITLIAYPVNGGPPCYKVVPLSSISLINRQSTNLTNNPPLIATINDTNTSNCNEIVDLTCENMQCNENLESIIKIDFSLSNYKLGNTGLRTKSGFVSHPDLFEMWKGDAHKSSEKYYKKLYEKKYNEMLSNRTFSLSGIYKNNEKTGFTSQQKQLFEQQLRIHVQFLTQNYLQTYSHPQFWPKAKAQKDMLYDLKQKCGTNDKSAFNAWNLKESINLINEWESELAEISEENQKFMEFIYHQIDRYESNKRPCSNRVIKFPPKTLKKILQSNVFLYPELLPRLPFKNSNHPEYHDLAPIESHLLAHELEKYLPGVEKQIKEENRKNNAVKLACDKISYDIMKGKTGRRLYDFYKQELISENNNPLKYFDERKCAPPFQHILIPINFNCVQPPIKRKHLLPMLWKEFATELETIELLEGNDKVNEIEWAKKQETKQKRKERKEYRKERKKEKSRELKKKKSTQSQQNVVINLNYVLENPNQNEINLENGNSATVNNPQPISNNIINTANPITKIERRISGTDYSQVFTKIHEPLDIKFGDDASYLQHLNVQYPKNYLDHNNITNLPLNDNCNTSFELSSNNILMPEINTSTETNNSTTKLQKNCSGQKRLTDYFSPTSSNHNNSKGSTVTTASDIGNDLIKIVLPKSISTTRDKEDYQLKQQKRIIKIFKLQNRGLRFSIRRSRYGYRSFKIIKRLKERKRLRNKLKNLFIRYWKYLHQICNKYENILLKKCYVHFKKLEIYSDFLETLKKICEKTLIPSKIQDEEILVLDETKHLPQMIRNDITSSETGSTGEENLIQIIMPPRCNSDVSHDEFSDTPHNPITANNFFDKVDERFCRFGKEIKFRKFLSILKSFDPDRYGTCNGGNSTVWLYSKMEKLFLPEYSDLAEIFLHFLLPAEAYEASNFLRNYMITNKDTFVQDFLQYFNEYPKKNTEIYQCLNELSDQNIQPSTEKIKFKLSTLVSDNLILNKWLQQIFVDEKILNFSKISSLENQTSITFDAKDLICDISELQPSEFRYVNARLLSVSKVFLPETLASIANSLIKGETVAIVSLSLSPQNNNCNDQFFEINNEHQNNSEEILIENCPIEKDYHEFNNIKDLIENVNLEVYEIDIAHDRSKRNEKVENNVKIVQDKNEKNIQQMEFKDKETFSELLVDEQIIENPKFETTNFEKFEAISVDSALNNLKEKRDNNKSDIKLRKSNNILQKSQKNFKNERDAISTEHITRKKSQKRKNIKKSLEDKNISKYKLSDAEISEENSITKVENQITSAGTSQSNSWTIDEDRIILEEARLNFDSHKDLLNCIATKIIGKTCSEIDKRYKFLINLLSQLKQ